MVHPFFGFELRPFLGDFSDYLKHVVTDVDTVSHRLFVGVFGHNVFFEKTNSALVWRGGQANQKGVKVVQHLHPQVVDAAVAFVDDDEIKCFHGDGRVVAHNFGLLAGLLDFVERHILSRIVNRLARQDRVHTLNGGDNDLGMRVDGAAGEALHVVQLGKFATIVGRRVGHELLVRLFAQIAGIDQKQNTFGTAKFKQAVDRGDSGEGFARTGSHMYQSAGFVAGERLFQPRDGADLAVA